MSYNRVTELVQLRYVDFRYLTVEHETSHEMSVTTH